jgi:hypothetical protein
LVPAIDDSRAIDGTDDEARHVVFAVGVEAGHLGGLAAQQRAAVVLARPREALDDLLRHIRREATSGEIIQEEQRRRALHEDVVDAVIHQVDTDRPVTVRQEGDFQLGADAVGARHEHRLLEGGGVEFEQPAERADFREHTGRKGGLRQRLDAANGLVAGIDINT